MGPKLRNPSGYAGFAMEYPVDSFSEFGTFNSMVFYRLEPDYAL